MKRSKDKGTSLSCSLIESEHEAGSSVLGGNHAPMRPSLQFHSHHGEHVEISKDGTEARRVRSYCKGIVFSNRPIEKGERVCFRITEQTAGPPNSVVTKKGEVKAFKWSGSLRIGITTHNPSSVDLTKALYLCPDLTTRSGFWARPLPDNCCTVTSATTDPSANKDRIIHFECLPDNSTIVFGINGVTKGTAFENVDTSVPLWAVFDIYGTTLAIQLLDSAALAPFIAPKSSALAKSFSSLSSLPLSKIMSLKHRQNSLSEPSPSQMATMAPAPPPSGLNRSSSSTAPASSSSCIDPFPNLRATPTEIQSALSLSARPVSTNRPSSSPSTAKPSAAPSSVELSFSGRHRSRHFSNLSLKSLKFHRELTGRNVVLSEEGGCARLAMGEFCSGYVFTPRPIAVNETVVIRIVENDWDYDGGLAFGLTTCDPSSLCQGHLPDDADNLLDRPEYWIVAKDVATKPKEGQEYAFTLRKDGTVQISRNNNKASDFLFVDISQSFWMFFELYGTTRKILLLGSCISSTTTVQNHKHHPVSTTPALPTPATTIPSLTVNLPQHTPSSARTPAAQKPAQRPSTIPSSSRNPAGGSGSIRDLIDLSTDIPSPSFVNSPLNSSRSVAPTSSPSVASVTGQIYSLLARTNRSASMPATPDTFPQIPGRMGETALSNSECVVCFEDLPLAVIYSCGHQVMCYGCATSKFGRGKPCPICRQPIKDIIKTYRG